MNSHALNPIPDVFGEILDLIRRGIAVLAGITTALCTSFKVELLKGVHSFANPGGDAFKLALFKQGVVGTYDATTTNYAAMGADEVPNGGGYATGGVALVNTTPVSGGVVAYTTPNGAAVWAGATFNTDGCMMYNTTEANAGVFVYNFGGTLSVVAGTLTINMPVNAQATGLVRLG